VALAIYRDRFADASDFTFLLVGNFDPSVLKPLVETYLGGLPATGRQESWRDVGIESPEGVVRFEVKKGLEPQSQVDLQFSGPAEWSRERAHEIRSLAQVLQIRLREVLREDLGGTYGARVSGTLTWRPVERYQFAISFGCDPARVETLIDAVFREIESFQRDGIAETYLQKIREIQRRQRETDLETNRFWIQGLASYYSQGLDPRLFLAYDELVESSTSESLQAAARRYLNEERYVLGVLQPAEDTDSGE
jgi:zinc protease